MYLHINSEWHWFNHSSLLKTGDSCSEQEINLTASLTEMIFFTWSFWLLKVEMFHPVLRAFFHILNGTFVYFHWIWHAPVTQDMQLTHNLEAQSLLGQAWFFWGIWNSSVHHHTEIEKLNGMGVKFLKFQVEGKKIPFRNYSHLHSQNPQIGDLGILVSDL